MKYAATVISVFLLSVSLSHAVDPYDPNKNQNQNRSLNDPDKLSRPVTNELKGAEIKEYRDKMKMARDLVFRERTA